MKIKFYILIISLHLLVLSGCGISKDESSLIIDAPANSKVERTIKNFIPHYEITFPEEDNHLSIIKIPIKPSDEFITTFLDTFAKNFKDELIKQLEPTGIKLEEIRSDNINLKGPVYDSKGNIIGMAVKRFNVTRSDNYNFAIKGSTVKQFLDANNIMTKPADRLTVITSTKIFDIASKQTVMIVCHR